MKVQLAKLAHARSGDALVIPRAVYGGVVGLELRTARGDGLGDGGGCAGDDLVARERLRRRGRDGVRQPPLPDPGAVLAAAGPAARSRWLRLARRCGRGDRRSGSGRRRCRTSSNVVLIVAGKESLAVLVAVLPTRGDTLGELPEVRLARRCRGEQDEHRHGGAALIPEAVNAAGRKIQEVSCSTLAPARSIEQVDPAFKDVERLGERPVVVRRRATRGPRHIPAEQAVALLGEGA